MQVCYSRLCNFVFIPCCYFSLQFRLPSVDQQWHIHRDQSRLLVEVLRLLLLLLYHILRGYTPRPLLQGSHLTLDLCLVKVSRP